MYGVWRCRGISSAVWRAFPSFASAGSRWARTQAQSHRNSACRVPCVGLAAVRPVSCAAWRRLCAWGHYFAIARPRRRRCFRELVNSATDLTGGGMGLNLPVIGDQHGRTAGAVFFYAMLALYGDHICRDALGQVLQARTSGCAAIQQNESAADMLGVNTTLYKICAFMLSPCSWP